MGTEHDHENENCDSCGRPMKDARNFAELRQQVTTLTTERDGYRDQLLDSAITGAGFDPKLGIVKRLAAEFTGELTADAFKTFATAEGLAPAAGDGGDGGGDGNGQRSDAEQQLDQLQGAGDRLRDSSRVPDGGDDVEQKKATALAAGNIGQLLDLEIASRATA